MKRRTFMRGLLASPLALLVKKPEMAKGGIVKPKQFSLLRDTGCTLYVDTRPLQQSLKTAQKEINIKIAAMESGHLVRALKANKHQIAAILRGKL